MRAEDIEDAIPAVRRQLDDALAAVPAATPSAGDVHINGGTAINVGNSIHIGSQTIHQAPAPPPKGRS